MNNVVIFSLEGVESNTEVNFFEGMAIHFSINNLKIYAAGKQGIGSKSLIRVENFMGKTAPTLLVMGYPLYVFFIGDGDILNDIKSMERSKETIIKWLNKLFKEGKETIIEKKLIYEKNKSFDKVLLENKLVRESGVMNSKTKNHKKKNNKHLFKNIVNTGFKENQKHDIEQDKKFIKKIFENKKYEKLVRIIL